MPDLTPMTRQEKFLNGDTDLEPITRREHFYAGRESELPEGHQEPETREEWFIKEYRGGGGGDITVESLSVTSNGTYTAPSGKAYSPVNVNVPLPQNAYLLKSVNTPTPIASFSDGEEMIMPSLKVAIEPQQEGSGDPSPTNIRPISGWSEANVTVADDVETPTVSNVYTIDLDGTRYGGTLDVVSGVLTVTHGSVVFDGSNDENWAVQGTAGFFIDVSDKKVGMGNYIANNYKATNSSGWDQSTPVGCFSGHPTLHRLYFRYPYEGFSADLTAWRTWLSKNNVQVVYELATPTTFYTQPTAVKSLLGQNNVWADTGDITDAEYFSKEV